MVGTAIREQSPRIAQIASDETQRMENPLLPYTRSEIALPLMVGDRVLGTVLATVPPLYSDEEVKRQKRAARLRLVAGAVAAFAAIPLTIVLLHVTHLLEKLN